MVDVQFTLLPIKALPSAPICHFWYEAGAEALFTMHSGVTARKPTSRCGRKVICLLCYCNFIGSLCWRQRVNNVIIFSRRRLSAHDDIIAPWWANAERWTYVSGRAWLGTEALIRYRETKNPLCGRAPLEWRDVSFDRSAIASCSPLGSLKSLSPFRFQPLTSKRSDQHTNGPFRAR